VIPVRTGRDGSETQSSQFAFTQAYKIGNVGRMSQTSSILQSIAYYVLSPLSGRGHSSKPGPWVLAQGGPLFVEAPGVQSSCLL